MSMTSDEFRGHLMRPVSLTRESFARLLGIRLVGDAFSPASLEYLWGYLEAIHASSVICETHYIDRHFLDDFAHYYARAFRPPVSHCKRLHFFSASASDLDQKIFDAMTRSGGGRHGHEARIQEDYLGFVVKRPLASAPVGRTVLRTYPPDGGRRQYTAVRPYQVHLLGLTLSVDGLAYQQQDGGAAVCASTALWSALQRVARVAGHRTPTPSEITRASGTPFAASHGLDDRQMATALANLGYAADYFAPAENRPLFRAKLAVCLSSHLPVILLISKKEKTGAGEVRLGHAVAVTGYAIDSNASRQSVPSPLDIQDPIEMVAASVQTIYVHDDNLGSHAHYELFDWNEEKSDDGDPALGLLRGRTGVSQDWWLADRWRIDGALVPKPPKLRMSIENLFVLMWSFAQQVFPLVLPDIPLHFSAQMTTGIEYRAALFGRGLDPGQMRVFQERVIFPRFLGVFGAYSGDTLVCEFLVDVTAIDRVGDETSLLAAVAPAVRDHSPTWKRLAAVFGELDVPFITAPRSPLPTQSPAARP